MPETKESEHFVKLNRPADVHADTNTAHHSGKYITDWLKTWSQTYAKFQEIVVYLYLL